MLQKMDFSPVDLQIFKAVCARSRFKLSKVSRRVKLLSDKTLKNNKIYLNNM